MGMRVGNISKWWRVRRRSNGFSEGRKQGEKWSRKGSSIHGARGLVRTPALLPRKCSLCSEEKRRKRKCSKSGKRSTQLQRSRHCKEGRWLAERWNKRRRREAPAEW